MSASQAKPDRASLLALDTSTESLTVSLSSAHGQAWYQQQPGGVLASTRLLPALMAMLQQAGLALSDLDALAFGQGPGAFTGLRTACAVAQGLGLGADKPVLPIDSLLLVAEDARAQARPEGQGEDGLWWVAMDARMDEAYAAAYLRQDGQWHVAVAPGLYALDALGACWLARPPNRLAGNAAAAFGQRLPIGQAQLWPDQTDRAAALLRLAQAAWRAGRAVPADQAMPLYLRDKVALTTAERAHAQALRCPAA